MWNKKQCGQTVRNSDIPVFCIDTYQVNVVSIIHSSSIKKPQIKIKQQLASVAKVFNTFFKHTNFTHIMLEMRKLNFRKTAVWTLIVPNCWKILRQCFVSTHQKFQVFNLHLWFRYFNWIFDSFDINFETKRANFQMFERRCFLYSIRSSKRC